MEMVDVDVRQQDEVDVVEVGGGERSSPPEVGDTSRS